MDLHSGLPYWVIKNELYNYFHPLEDDLITDVLIIGSGITGALVAHELCEAGIPCAVIDKRTIATGSSAASTSQLQYEIDVPLSEMAAILDEKTAVEAYQASLQSITDIEQVFKKTGLNPGFARIPSLFLASYKKDLKLLEREYDIRRKYSLPVDFLSADELQQKHRISAPGALKNNEAAQMDCYQAATSLLQHHLNKKELRLYSHTEITRFQEKKGGYALVTHTGKTVRCKYVVIAAGFEAGKFLPKPVMQLNSTYALISQPVSEALLWPERSLIWETKRPYFYMRTTEDNRMMIGGEDEEFKDPVKRDALLRAKVRKLENQFRKLYPDIPFQTDMAWCGTFSSTTDGLPYIGPWPGKPRMFFALGYGGNGITFSMIAAQIIRHRLQGINDNREDLFGFSRSVR